MTKLNVYRLLESQRPLLVTGVGGGGINFGNHSAPPRQLVQPIRWEGAEWLLLKRAYKLLPDRAIERKLATSRVVVAHGLF